MGNSPIAKNIPADQLNLKRTTKTIDVSIDCLGDILQLAHKSNISNASSYNRSEWESSIAWKTERSITNLVHSELWS